MTTLTIMRALPHEVDPVVYNMLHEDPSNVSYSVVGGLSDQIRDLKESIELPLMNHELFIRVGIKPPKRVSNIVDATQKALLRALKLFFLGVLLQGGYLHGTSLTYGVDIEGIHWMGILQRISIGYIVATLCEIWLPCQRWRGVDFFRRYYWQCVGVALS
ncbi:uncharacterized protein LOC114270085 isoform X1 [Camellia sinensis]|uniref:uncharacterized protein LOC114270085 isoform X1 n=2 Tax=Camellia sinensis TaxID=4442 RepID=UPI0010356476|nr:uncharacterized protein LOC114270085 isoform X1 [Camellia sinensis]XP_028067291.1 uncharacterized protein LOC114270085 isoform X1 [Camellia sinensis]XP_028067296.1 uncharacterized protein LOC114270085 isoform X1 [Camellia sinensis]XP_028067300.1 uncharacterized protein LOC114270085 isoform X1 [Camellia sinensis]XP_028067308.1 uncharacterized protein LOC114270085 isoform X1 [Camellia sinensis]XP_028067318.1 uncharacterized protein LOC114270085 isoform X1 [Camellia sinensis]XP_028067324.1 un